MRYLARFFGFDSAFEELGFIPLEDFEEEGGAIIVSTLPPRLWRKNGL